MSSTGNDQKIYPIEINRPPVNALDSELIDKLTKEIQYASKEKDKVIIIKGAKGHFSAGLDVKQLQNVNEKEREFILDKKLGTLMKTIADCQVPIVSAISGHCLGAGAAVAALSDYRVMAQGDFKFGLPEISIGLELPVRIKQVFSRIIGDHMAQRLCVEGYLLDSTNALRIGMVDEVVNVEDINRTAEIWCEHMLSLPQDTMLAMRHKCREDIRLLYKDI